MSIEEVILDHPIPFFKVSNHNSPRCISLLKRLRPDVLVVTNARILSEEVITVPPRGTLNLHLGKLPEYAGLASIFWALYRGETEIGVTVHFMEKGLDAGSIVLRDSLEVRERDREESLYKRALEAGAKMILESLSLMESGEVTPIPQDKERLTYYSWPGRRERALLRKRLKKRGARGRVKNLHVITRLIRGGAQENTLLTVTGLDCRRYETVLVSGPTTGLEGEMESHIRESGVDLRIIPELVRELSPLRDTIALLKLFSLMKREKFDIVHTHTSKAGFLGRIAARMAGVPIVIHTPHGHIFYGYFGPLKNRVFILLEKFAALFADRIITLTERGKREYVERRIAPADRFIPIYSGMDLSSFHPGTNPAKVREELGLRAKDQAVGTVGRLVPVKGHRYLIEAASQVVRVIPGVKFFLVGDGPCREELEGQVARLNLGNNVHFLGLRESGLEEIMAALDLFVLPSLNEGMGRVLIQAMALGRPVVATEVSGIPEVVKNNETGILVPPGESKALAEAIITLLRDKKRAGEMGRAGRERVNSSFTSRIMIEKIANLYEELMAEKGLISKVILSNNK
jgi:glycosyltransferase involved in cell wall biosynthesis